MSKKSTFANMVICLTAVTLICSVLLGGVYVLTEKPIEDAIIAKINNAISEVAPKFDNIPSEEKFEIETDEASGVAYPAKMGSETVGYAIETATSKGFGGAIKIMVGFDMNGNIINTKVVSHAETPGLGAKMVEDEFKNQFCEMNPAKNNITVKKDGGEIDAITAATISSRAYTDAIAKAYSIFKKITDNNSK